MPKILDTTSKVLRMVTGAAASVTASVDWVDKNGDTYTPGNTLTPAVTTATTTTIVPAPAASTQRGVQTVHITNNHASAATQVTVQVFDGTNSADIFGVTLLPGENVIVTEEGEPQHRDTQGALYNYIVPAMRTLGFTGIIAESIPRELCPEVNTAGPASGTLFMQAIYLQAGQLVSNIHIFSATTAAGTPTNYNAGLYDVNRNLLAQGTNKTTEAWAANTQKTFALTTPYRVPTSGLYYVGYYMTATTVATLKGGTAKTGGQLASTAPALHGTSSTGLTTTLPNPAAAIAGGTANIYVAVS